MERIERARVESGERENGENRESESGGGERERVPKMRLSGLPMI